MVFKNKRGSIQRTIGEAIFWHVHPGTSVMYTCKHKCTSTFMNTHAHTHTRIYTGLKGHFHLLYCIDLDGAHGPVGVISKGSPQSCWKALLSCSVCPEAAWMVRLPDPCMLTHTCDPGQGTGHRAVRKENKELST